MRALASFASSREGEEYAFVCRSWGVDPARFLESEDDVVAYDFRRAMLMALHRDAPDEPVSEAARHRELVARAKAVTSG